MTNDKPTPFTSFSLALSRPARPADSDRPQLQPATTTGCGVQHPLERWLSSASRSWPARRSASSICLAWRRR
jgi:hypothetical protein